MGIEEETTSEGIGAGEAQSEQSAPELPPIDFSTFILSLATGALYQMGLAPDPDTGHAMEPNLVLAHQTIDTLEMLRARTRGNLDEAERKLFESILYDLRLRYVELQE